MLNTSEEIVLLFRLSCIHVNGRLDRNNVRIDELNRSLFEAIHQEVEWVDTSFMEDKFGILKESHTKDGLHLLDEGYEALKSEIIMKMKRIGL